MCDLLSVMRAGREMSATYPKHRFGGERLVPAELAVAVAAHCAAFPARNHLRRWVPTDQDVAGPEGGGCALQDWEAAVTAARAALNY